MSAIFMLQKRLKKRENSLNSKPIIHVYYKIAIHFLKFFYQAGFIPYICKILFLLAIVQATTNNAIWLAGWLA